VDSISDYPHRIVPAASRMVRRCRHVNRNGRMSGCVRRPTGTMAEAARAIPR